MKASETRKEKQSLVNPAPMSPLAPVALFASLALVLAASPSSQYCEIYQRNCRPLEVGEDPEETLSALLSGNLSLLAPVPTHPYLALVGYGQRKEWLCAATVISENFLLTSAHCAQRGTPKWIRVGESTDDVKDFAVTQTLVHPEFDKTSLANNLALIKTEGLMDFGGFIKPACVHNMPTVPYQEVEAITFAEGSGRENELWSGVTHSETVGAKMKLLNVTMCEHARGIHLEQSKFLCLGPAPRDAPLTSGLEGGALVVRLGNRCLQSVVGLFSVQEVSQYPGAPLVFTRTSSYVPWIQRTVWPWA